VILLARCLRLLHYFYIFQYSFEPDQLVPDTAQWAVTQADQSAVTLGHQIPPYEDGNDQHVDVKDDSVGYDNKIYLYICYVIFLKLYLITYKYKGMPQW
jgi:hypothetical protein